MGRRSLVLLVLSLLLSSVRCAPSQIPLKLSPEETRPRKDNGLKGRFLHLTDMHPDPYYRKDRSESSSCHRNKPKKEKERGGYYGLPYGDCDSPLTLTNFTLDFLEKHWAKEVDFVIWTGDSARHDNDRELPRTPNEIYDLNRAMVSRMNEVFTSRGIPVVPCIGNNDVWPHNIMTAGPNSITNEYSSIWRSFIPFESFQVFQRGGYYSVEVIPNELAVISLNTMYFYDSNKAVGGCEYQDREDPGNLQFDWLEVQLDRYRDRGMQVWLSGHVPPSPGNYFPGCFVRYVDLALRFQDTILGHLYGHMNVDHFFFLSEDDLELPDQLTPSTAAEQNKTTGDMRRAPLVEVLFEDFSELPKKSKIDLDEFAIINVSPSVVPNPYLPSFRVFAYNISGADLISDTPEDTDDGSAGSPEESKKKKKKKKGKKGRDHKHKHNGGENSTIDCKKEQNQEKWACRPKKPRHASEDAPSRTNTLWTPLGYAQYWLPDVGIANKSKRPKFKLEYLTYSLPSLHPEITGAGVDVGGQTPQARSDDEDEEGSNLYHYPVPLKELPRSLREWNGTRTKSKYAPYKLADLTVGSYVRLARRLGDGSRTKLRKRFRRYMYMGGEED